MTKPDFRKYHGLGNDYLVLDPADFPELPAPGAVRALLDRHRGVGADGLLYGPAAGDPELALRIFNPDGSEAGDSGNGRRIYAWHLRAMGYAASDEVRFRTAGGHARAFVVDAGRGLVRTDMGPASFDAAAVPVEAKTAEVVDRRSEFCGCQCRITCVSTGNPHCVVVGQPADEATARALGPVIERSPLFPKRVNVDFLEVDGPAEIRIAIWTRGTGYTLASGSSCCAAAAAARRLGLVGDEVRVTMPGGVLDLRFEKDAILMTGPVAEVCEGRFSEALLLEAGLRRRARGANEGER